jgi:hypothetical protein
MTLQQLVDSLFAEEMREVNKRIKFCNEVLYAEWMSAGLGCTCGKPITTSICWWYKKDGWPLRLRSFCKTCEVPRYDQEPSVKWMSQSSQKLYSMMMKRFMHIHKRLQRACAKQQASIKKMS